MIPTFILVFKRSPSMVLFIVLSTVIFNSSIAESTTYTDSISTFLCNGKSYDINGILLPKLFWPTVRKNCSSDREKLLKFEAEGQEFAKFLRSLEQFKLEKKILGFRNMQEKLEKSNLWYVSYSQILVISP